EDDQADYPADGGDGDDEPSDDDDDNDTDDEDPKEKPFEEDDEEEEEHPAPADSSTVPIVDPILPAGDTEALEADEPTHRPRSPIIILLSQTHLHRARKTKMAPKKRTTRVTPATTTTPTTTITNAQLQALIDRDVVAALAKGDVDRSRNGDNRNDSGISERRKMNTLQECTYTDFLKY
nr:hypothetical protein [Tanacetum cinerariifolium]